MSQQPKIGWDPFEFVDPGTPPPAEGYLVEAMADGTNFGNPQPRIEIVQSLLTDGALAVLEGWDNREAPIRLRISAQKGASAGPALAAAESALMTGVLTPTKPPLVYVPAATGASACAFDVVAARLDRDTSEGWDREEKQRAYRYYLLTLTCLPFARTRETVAVPALAPPPNPGTPPVVVDIDTCSSFAGWSATFVRVTSTSSGTTGGYVHATGKTDVFGGAQLTLKRTGTVTMSSPLLLVDVECTGPFETDGRLTLTLSGGSTQVLSPIATRPSAIAGVQYVYQPPASFTAFQLTASAAGAAANSTGSLRVHHVSRADKLVAASSTNRQQTRTVAVVGSAPTQAAIRLYDATPAALGSQILVHTSRNTAWSPPLRRWLITAGAVPDANTVSGAKNGGGGSAFTLVYRIPSALLTEGTYALSAMMVANSDQDLVTWSARMVNAAGAATIGSSVVVTGSARPRMGTVLNQFNVRHLGRIALPVVAVEGDQMVELTINLGGSMALDELWLFGLHDGVLTHLEDADSLTWLEIRSPELGASRPSVYGGTGAKGANSVCVDWKCQAFGAHRFDPGLMQIFTVTSSSLVSQSEIEFYPRYHSHIA